MRTCALALVALGAASAPAQTVDRLISGPGTLAFVGFGLLREGGNRSYRVGDALLTSIAASEILKRLTREPRPDGTTLDSFPSGHATAAFATATMMAQYHPREAALWFAGAAAIGYSRVALRRHHWWDVLAGAALGYGVARLEVSSPRGLLAEPTAIVTEGSRSFAPVRGLVVQPWLGRGYGLMLAGRL